MSRSGKERLPKAKWTVVTEMHRPFVRYVKDQGLTCKTWHSRMDGYADEVRLSVIVPSKDGERSGYFPKLLEQIHVQSFRGFELIVVCGDSRQGRAINIGATMARGKYLLTLDDDTSLPDPGTFGKLVELMEDHPDIGMAGGNNVVARDASAFLRRAMSEIPRRSWEPVLAITDSDLAEHPCLIMRADAFKAVGGENELLPRGLDPYLRQAFREAGWRVVVLPGIIYHHLPPDNGRSLLRQFFRNGRQAAFVNLRYPQWVIETPEKHGPFQAQIPLIHRMLRFPFRLLEALVRGKFLWLLCETAYAVGFAYEYVQKRVY